VTDQNEPNQILRSISTVHDHHQVYSNPSRIVLLYMLVVLGVNAMSFFKNCFRVYMYSSLKFLKKSLKICSQKCQILLSCVYCIQPQCVRCCGLRVYIPTPTQLAPLVSMLIRLIARDFPHSVQVNVWISFVPVYQNVVDLIVSLLIRSCPSKFMCEHCTHDN
jgi:hypothetical protein